MLLATIEYPLCAQDFTGFHGRVTDPSGAAAPAIIVKVTEETRGFVNTAKANEVGDYTLQGILPGSYTIEVEMPQFKKYRNMGVIVYARQSRRVDIKLDLGDVVQTVTVKEEGSRIETDTARIAYKAPLREISALNIPGSGIGFKSANPGSEAWSQTHGNHANNTNAEQDGITNDGYGLFRMPQESVREINFIALNAPAEFRTSTTIAVAGRTGSNDYHAEYFINWAHDRFNSLPAGAVVRPTVQRPSVFHEAIVSGPVVIPKVYNGKNRSFFYFMYQPLKSRSASNSLSYIAPTARMRNGDFSEWAAATNRNLIDPLTGQQFSGNVIPKDRFGPVWNRLLGIGDGVGGVPTPNRSDLFARNYENPEQLAQLTADIERQREPALPICVDHEGGRVQRFREGFTAIPPMRLLGKLWDRDRDAAKQAAASIGYIIAAELGAHGVDFSFAPVLDLDYGGSSVIGDRALHFDPTAVGALGACLVRGLAQGGVAAVAKHFPGHGYAEADSHVAVPRDERTFKEIARKDIAPYKQVIEAGLAAVMPAHVFVLRRRKSSGWESE